MEGADTNRPLSFRRRRTMTRTRLLLVTVATALASVVALLGGVLVDV